MKSSIICLLAVVFLSSSFIGNAQSAEDSARACLEHYMSGDGNRMEKAFHPSATMKYIDAQTGVFTDVPIADFIVRAKANTGPIPKRTIEILSLNIEGNAAQAKIKIAYEKVILFDYMNLLLINNEWKIVSKIFSRKPV